MDISALVIFGLALAVAAGSPGPSLAALVARVIAHGWREVLPFAAAMWVGEALWLTLAVFGLSALAETFHLAFVAVKYCGVAYLLWLAWRMWRAPVAVEAQLVSREPEMARSLGDIANGLLSLQTLNPELAPELRELLRGTRVKVDDKVLSVNLVLDANRIVAMLDD